jgi:hypothetical protein
MRRIELAIACVAVACFAACGGHVPQDAPITGAPDAEGGPDGALDVAPAVAEAVPDGAPDVAPAVAEGGLDGALDLASAVAGKTYFYWEDRVWQAGADSGTPLALPLPESTFQPITPTALYMASISSDTMTLTLTPVRSGDPSYTGVLQLYPAPPARPQLDWNLQPSFAGAAFSVWSTAGVLNAGLTILGSGVPVVSANRGVLRPAASH